MMINIEIFNEIIRVDKFSAENGVDKFSPEIELVIPEILPSVLWHHRLNSSILVAVVRSRLPNSISIIQTA